MRNIRSMYEVENTGKVCRRFVARIVLFWLLMRFALQQETLTVSGTLGPSQLDALNIQHWNHLKIHIGAL